MDAKEQFAFTLKKLRETAGLTQRELARETGISLSAIIAYENKQREPNSRNMAILERFFQITGDELRGGVVLSHEAKETQEEHLLLTSLSHDILSLSKRKTEYSQHQLEQVLLQLFKILHMENEALMSVLLDMVNSDIRNLRHGLEKAAEIPDQIKEER